MLQLPALAMLAKDLHSLGSCRFIVPNSSQASEFVHEEKSFDGRTIDEVFERIDESGSWIALYNIEAIPRYATFLREVIGTVRPMVEREQSRITRVTGFIFISAPPSVTPFHIDRENNFWLQIKGRKTLTVWNRDDTKVVPTKDVENFITFGTLDNVRLKDEFISRGREFDTGPGDGVYFPSTTPHMTKSSSDWVTPGDGVSISLGVTFYTDVTRRHAKVHQVNRLLRRFGAKPTAPGKSFWRDCLKAPFAKIVIAIQRRRFNYVPPPGTF